MTRFLPITLMLAAFSAAGNVHAQTHSDLATITTTETESVEEPETQEPADEATATARQDAAALDEDPEAQRRAQIEDEPELRHRWPTLELYGSVRLHAIDAFIDQDESKKLALGDGGSRIGIRGQWQATTSWSIFGRGEGGFDILDTFTEKAGDDGDSRTGLRKRLLYGGLDSQYLTTTYGKSWSTYYKIAGMADRFSIFGGSAAGVYNASTDGGATGTGRADEVIQARVYTSALEALRIKPFNLNLQYQTGQHIPHVQDRSYGNAYGASAWLETERDQGLGLAYHLALINDPEDPMIRAAGIDGDAQALALSFRSYGERWYAALVVARHENIETTDQFLYINGRGVELYAQWEFSNNWWLIGGGNWLKPDDDDPDAGQYEVSYRVIGVRYSLDSFNRMLYAEYRIENGTLFDGTPREDEITLGIRWDFGY